MRARSGVTAALNEPRPSSGAIPQHAREVVTSNGEPLDTGTRAHFESHFGHDFGSVRIHDDSRASESAKALNARAYTIGSDIVLRSRERDPALLAHELTHVVQQTSGNAHVGVQRQPWSHRTDFKFDRGFITTDDLLDGYVMSRLHSMSRPELRAYRMQVADPAVIAYIDMLLMAPPTQLHQGGWLATNRQNVQNVSTSSYWYNRTFESYVISPTPQRMHNDPDEYDAVYAAFWNVLSSPPASAWSELVTIPPAGKRKSQLLYRFRVAPPAAGATKPLLTIEFVTEQPGNVVNVAEMPPAKTRLPKITFDFDLGFDEGSDVYFKRHPDLRRQVEAWLDKASGEFDQVLITKSQPVANATPVQTLFQITGKRKPDGSFENLSISLLEDKQAETARLPSDYHSRDYGDLMIERLQRNPHSKLKDKLGWVDMSGVPQEEAVYVKYMIASYFDTMETRNAEVDVIVPITKTGKEVFYSLRFRADNEVDVQRIGEKGANEKLDPDRLDVARVRGYSENSADPVKLKTWLGKRYRGLKPAGTTVEELRKSANDGMKANADKPEWFKQNYTMFVLNGADTLKRLRNSHKLTAKATPATDAKDFTGEELKVAELSLQTLTDTIIARLAAVRLGRKSVARESDGTEKPSIAGNTFTSGSANTVIMYERAFGATIDGTYFKHADNLFVGGTDDVHRAETADFTHEFGHVLEFNKFGLREAFLKFVKREHIDPITPYAKSQPEKDFFTEAFSMYSTDPEFLKTNHMQVYTWMDSYAKTGKIPK